MKDLPLSEITLRKYEKPYQLNNRELVKKICLSLGFLQPGDSRDIIVDLFLALLEAKNKKTKLNLEDLKNRAIESRKKANLEIKGVADSNIRRQLKKLKDMFIIDRTQNQYYIAEFDSLEKIFNEKIENFYLRSIIERISEYLKELEK